MKNSSKVQHIEKSKKKGETFAAIFWFQKEENQQRESEKGQKGAIGHFFKPSLSVKNIFVFIDVLWGGALFGSAAWDSTLSQVFPQERSSFFYTSITFNHVS